MSLVSLDLPLRLSASLPLPIENPDLHTVPWIRETTFGQTLGVRAKALEKIPPNGHLGPPDLVHWGRHYGERSPKFMHNPFAPPNAAQQLKEEDGYVGHFHFVNGLELSAEAVENYVFTAIGLESRADGSYGWRKNVDVASYGVYTSKQMVATFCLYNTLARAEFRARYVLTPGPLRLVVVDTDYSLFCRGKLLTYSPATINEVSASFWEELAVSSLVRLFVAIDDPSRQLCGTVSLPSQIGNKESLWKAVDRVAAQLPRGHLVGTRACFGGATSCGNDVKTSRFRNHLVDSLVRLVMLEGSGSTAEHALEEVQRHGNDFDYVKARLLRHPGINFTQRFLQLVHSHVAQNPTTTQTALLLIEQVRFLISRKVYGLALEIAAKAVELLPLDFDCWHQLALCYVLENKFEDALTTINALPAVLGRAPDGTVDGVTDTFAECFVERLASGEGLSQDTFEAFFPPPQLGGRDEGSVESTWYNSFRYRPNSRHPLVGAFYLTPLATATAIEASAVETQIIKVSGPSAPKYAFAAQSGGTVSILDFDRKSTWGRAYDLLTLMVAVVGWDNLVRTKANTFRSLEPVSDYVVDNTVVAKAECHRWLDQLFLVVYDDIRAMMGAQEGDRSALAWELLGLVGWSCKYNLRDSISSLATCVSGTSSAGGFDYYGTVRLLEIYTEFVLSDVDAAAVDSLLCIYDNRSYSNKLIVQTVSPKVYAEFVRKLLDNGYLSLDAVLLHVMKLTSWDLRWYSYVPSFLVTNTLVRLCAKFDPVHVRTRAKVVFQQFKAAPKQKKAAKFSLLALFGPVRPASAQAYEFSDSDTVAEYIDRVICWTEQLHEST